MYIVSTIEKHADSLGTEYPMLKALKDNPNIIALFIKDTYGQYIKHHNPCMIFTAIRPEDLHYFESYNGEITLKNSKTQ